MYILNMPDNKFLVPAALQTTFTFFFLNTIRLNMPDNKFLVPAALQTTEANPFLEIKQTLNGMVDRCVPDPTVPPNADPNGTSSVLTKDLPLNPNHNTWLRLFLPRQAGKASPATKLPLIVYLHGGGFVFSHANSIIYDVLCKGIVTGVGAIVVSVEYRLAPKHRLPAAYEDAIEGLKWVRNSQDDWVRDYADLSNCYICGTSAGGNLAYQAGLMATDLQPLKIKGMILHHPYFSGTQRTESEKKMANDVLLPLHSIDKMFDLCLPIGTDHDHEYCNPTANGGSKYIDRVKSLGWRILVTGVEVKN
ncbi:unnamed protein product [Ilex paraguariensis]|uniref:Alpha/beta hydrolase fold-3 domain-containing protein n=1 Tax=Ilex paraguariensis TaxID=185542 RepID=A0ABC8R2C3_9AQUA